jgi:type II secretory pathway component PulF
MNYFRYKCIASNGKVSSGFLQLPYQEVMSAISHIERDGSVTIYVKKLSRLAGYIYKLAVACRRDKLTRPVQAELLNNISVMLHAGMPLLTALEEAAASVERPRLAADIRNMIANIQGGASLSEAANHYRSIFPELIVLLMGIGEETGKIDQMLKAGSEHLTRLQRIISDTKQALLYPGFVFLVMGGGVIFWFAYVVPQIVSLFKEMSVALPSVTVMLIAVSEFVQAYYLHFLVGLPVAVLSVLALRRVNRPFKRTSDALLMRLPILGAIMNTSALAFISEYFSLLLNAGIDIRSTINILKDTVRNEVYRTKLAEVGGRLETGSGIAESFKQAIIFPAFVLRMMRIGEKSGTLTEQLDYVAEEYRNRLEVLVATIGKMIEPIALLIAGAIFAVIIAGLFLPIYDLVSRVGG